MTMHTLLRHLPHFGPSGVAVPAENDTPPARAPGNAAAVPRAMPEAPSRAALPNFSSEDLHQAVARARHEAHSAAQAEAQAAAEAAAEAALAASEAARQEEAAQMRAAFEQQLADARSAWCLAEGERLAAAVSSGFAELEARLGDALGKALTPFVGAALRARALDEVKGHIAALLSSRTAPLLTVSGPQDLVGALAQSLGSPPGMSFNASAQPDLRITCDDTVIETRLAAWAEQLGLKGLEQGGARVREG